jgi:hypothetical protein
MRKLIDSIKPDQYNTRLTKEVSIMSANYFNYFYNKQLYYTAREKAVVGYRKKALQALLSGIARSLMYLFA